jgi:threonine/homoserine/homoserine lactone efflux protein
MTSVLQGLKFGMLLQLAIGPVSLLIFKIAGNRGLVQAMSGTAAVVLVDSLFILLAILGIASFVGREKTRKLFNYAGAAIIALFGLATILDIFGINLIPGVGTLSSMQGASSFVEAFVLTAANPLTILFWAGVFTSRITEGKLSGMDVYLFGLGCAFSTLLALTAVAAIGTVSGTFLPDWMIDLLNFIIGIVLIVFALRMIFSEKKKSKVKVTEII